MHEGIPRDATGPSGPNLAARAPGHDCPVPPNETTASPGQPDAVFPVRTVLLGHAAIDADHLHLEQLLKRFKRIGRESPQSSALSEAACDLVEFVRCHFEHEEELMTAAGYPDAERHRRNHAETMQMLTIYLHRLALSPADFPSPLIADMIEQWYAGHLVEFDWPMVEFLLKAGQAPARRRRANG